jgi:hypothetical protein
MFVIHFDKYINDSTGITLGDLETSISGFVEKSNKSLIISRAPLYLLVIDVMICSNALK